MKNDEIPRNLPIKLSTEIPTTIFRFEKSQHSTGKLTIGIDGGQRGRIRKGTWKSTIPVGHPLLHVPVHVKLLVPVSLEDLLVIGQVLVHHRPAALHPRQRPVDHGHPHSLRRNGVRLPADPEAQTRVRRQPDQNVARMRVAVLEFEGLFGDRQSEGDLLENAPRLARIGQGEGFEVLAAVAEPNDDVVLRRTVLIRFLVDLLAGILAVEGVVAVAELVGIHARGNLTRGNRLEALQIDSNMKKKKQSKKTWNRVE